MAALEKAAVRVLVKAALKAVPRENLEKESAAVCQHVLKSAKFVGARRVGLYVAASRLREVDTTLLLEAVLGAGGEEQALFVPRVEDASAGMSLLRIGDLAELRAQCMGILEPEPTLADGSTPRESALDGDAPLDVLLLPGLAFDGAGRRLGRGGGYYDAFMQRARDRATARGWPAPYTIALAHRAQLLDQVPVAEHDIPVDALVTADGFVELTKP